MTLETATASYKTWLQELSTKQSEGGPTVFIPSENDPSDFGDNSTTTAPPATLSPENSTTLAASQDRETTTVQPPALQSNISSNQSLTESQPEYVNLSAHLPLDSNNVTEIPATTSLPSSTTTDRPSDPVALPDSSPLSNNSSVVGSSTTENPTTLTSTQPTKRPGPTAKRPSSIYISNDNPDIPWLILKGPEEEFLPEYYPSSAVDSQVDLPNVPVSVPSFKPNNNPSFAELYVDIDNPDENRESDPADTLPSIFNTKSYPKRKQPFPPAKVDGPLGNKRPDFPGNDPTPPTTEIHRHQSNRKKPLNGVANVAASAPEVVLIDVVLKSPNSKPENNISSTGESGKIVPISPSSDSIKSPPLSKLPPPATTIKASSSNRPNFYKPPRRNPLLTFDD